MGAIMNFDKETLTTWLKEGVVEVSFTKADGSKRVMSSTLQPALLPAITETAEKSERKKNDATLSVWSVKDNGWRSFRLDSITSVRVANAGAE